MSAIRLALAASLIFFFMVSGALAETTETEKELIIQNNRPEHALIQANNMGVDFITTPGEARILSSGTIRDAWAMIVAVIPLVEDTGVNTTWIPPTGTLRVGYGYTYNLPSNEPGCGSTYSLNSKGVKFNALAGVSPSDLNSTLTEQRTLGMKKGVANYSLTSKEGYVRFDVTTTFWVKYTERQHSLVEHCSGGGEGGDSGEGGEETCSTSCDYTGARVHEDRLPIQDSKSYTLYNLEHSEGLLIDHRFGDTQQGRFWVKATPVIDGLQVFLGASKFTFDTYDYHIVPAEFGMKKIQATPRNEIERKGYSGLFTDLKADPQGVSFYFTSGDFEPAKLNILNHFGEDIIPLEPIFPIETILDLETTKRQYRINGVIEAAATLTEDNETPITQKEIFFKYSSESMKALTDASGHATANFTPITGEGIMAAQFIGDDEHSEAHDTTHFSVGQYTFNNFLAAMSWIAMIYYITLRGGKYAWKLLIGRVPIKKQ